MKKLLSLIVTLIMVGCIFCVPASSEEAPISSDAPTYEVLATMDAQFAEPELREYLAENGIEVHAGHEIVALSVENETGDGLMGLQVIRQEGNQNQYKTNTLISLNENGNEIDAPIAVTPSLSRASTNISWVPNSITGGGPITINVTANYYIDVIGNFPSERYFVDPVSFTFSYRYNNSSAKVESINMGMDFCGKRCNSNYVVINDTWEERVASYYSVNPIANRSYTAYATNSSSYKLEYIQGSYDSQLYIVMETTVNNNWDNTTRPLILPEYL